MANIDPEKDLPPYPTPPPSNNPGGSGGGSGGGNSGGGPSREQAEALARQYGVSADSSSIDSFLSGRAGQAEYEADLRRRAAPTSHRTYDSQGVQNGGAPVNFNSGLSGAYHGVFSDPLTKQYEQLLQMQMGLYQQQQAAMQQAAQEAAQRRAATAAAVERLTQFTNQRVDKLQGPAYTGAEQDVLRTQLFDPMERDRQASLKRAYEQVSARGLEPTSGVAQHLLQEVNRAFDEQRTRAGGTLASRQIEEQRSREQEAQQLMQYLAMLPDATARGDLDFVAYMQNLINQPGTQALTAGQLLADLPTKRLNDALATMGVAPSIGSAGGSAIQLLQALQQQRYMQQQQQAQYWGQIGQSFAPY